MVSRFTARDDVNSGGAAFIIFVQAANTRPYRRKPDDMAQPKIGTQFLVCRSIVVDGLRHRPGPGIGGHLEACDAQTSRRLYASASGSSRSLHGLQRATEPKRVLAHTGRQACFLLSDIHLQTVRYR